MPSICKMGRMTSWRKPTMAPISKLESAGLTSTEEPWDQQPQTRLQRLTAVGPGNPGFAAFYPGCCNVFGFYDDLQGIEAGTFLYLVVGWYERREDDPLNPANALTNKVEWLRHFRDRWWKDKDTATTPTRTLCHGTLHSVKWDRKTKSGLPQEVMYQVAVGNTAIEALSALLTSNTVLEPFLSAFQYEMLANVDPLFGMPELDGELHRRRFCPVNGGTEWRLQPVERRAGAGLPEAPAKPRFPTDPEVATLFNQLCDAQQDCDRLERELASLREQYYAAWFQSKLLSPPSDLQNLIAACKGKIEKTQDDLQKAQGGQDDLQNAQGGIEHWLKQLTAKGIGITSLPPGTQESSLPLPPNSHPDYELAAAPLPSFWRASDPAVLLARPGNPAAHRHRYAGRPETPTCRVLEELLTGLTMTLTLGEPSTLMDVKAATKWAFPLAQKANSSLPFDEVKALYYESLLLDPSRAADLAQQAYGQAGQTGRDSRLVTTLAVQIKTFQQKLVGEQAVKNLPKQSVLPIHAVAEYDVAYHPLFMVWELEWAPSYEQAEGWSQNGKWELRDNTEYHWIGKGTDTLKTGRSYYGWAPLSLSLSQQLQARLKEAPDIAKPFADWSFLTQSVNGLTNMFIQREETLQLPPMSNDGKIDNTVWDLLGHAIRWSPLREDANRKTGFFPIRAGHFRLIRLSLVDAFGRVDTVIDPNRDQETLPDIVPAESLGAAQGPQSSWIPLPPRIVQPARLRCRWVSVADESNGRYRESNANPDTSPLIGWVVPNHFDHGLVVCDAKGKVRGELRRVVGEKPSLIWADVPGSVATPGGEPSLERTYHLEPFVQGLKEAAKNPDYTLSLDRMKSADSGVLDDLLKLIDRISLTLTTPAARRIGTLSMLLGHPLALVRAALDLEIWGRVAAGPPWVDPSDASSGGLQTTNFPIRLGDGRRSNDGLIGYFVGTNYSKMRLPFAAPPLAAPGSAQPTNKYFATNDSLELSPSAAGVTVTLLMDPRAGVHSSCGILPAQVLELSEQVVQEALSRIELSFRVGPVLGKPDSFRLPVPDDVEGSWSWFDFDQTRTEPERWRENLDVGIAETGAAVASELDQVQVYDGWLTIRKTDRKPNGA